MVGYGAADAILAGVYALQAGMTTHQLADSLNRPSLMEVRAIKRIADQLGVHPEALQTWVKQAEIEGRSVSWRHDRRRLSDRRARARGPRASVCERNLKDARGVFHRG
jgi:transposase-like protein